MTRHAFLILVFGGIFLAIMGRACAHPAESEPGTVPPSATWAPGQADPRGRAWLPVTGAVVYKSETTDAWGVWSWVDVAVARAADDAGKPTAAPVPSATRTPTATHPPRATRTPSATRPPRATRTARPTGTPTQGRMATVPACGCNTPEPGPGTRFPGCWPYGGTCAPTETPAPPDTPPASATWEPTPTPRVKVTPVAGGWVPVPEVFLYRFPIALVWRGRR